MADTPAAVRWRRLVAEHAKTDLSACAFATKRGLNPGTFTWWRARLKKLDAERRATAFAEIVVTPQPCSKQVIVLSFDDFRANLLVSDDTDLALLKRVVRALC